MAHRLSLLEPSDPYRVEMTEKLLHKLAHLGVIDRKVTLSQCKKVTVSAFCRYSHFSLEATLKACSPGVGGDWPCYLYG